MLTKWSRIILGVLVVALLVGGPIAYSRYRLANYRNFRVVEAGKVYRSGQLSVDTLQRIIKEYKIRTVLSLRYADHNGERPPDWEEEEYCNRMGINYVRIRPREWHETGDNRFVPADAVVAQFLEVMDKPEIYPVLIHCFAGKHRTGAFCAIYRMEYQRWSPEEALEELKAAGYSRIEEETDVLGYLSNYAPRWKQRQP